MTLKQSSITSAAAARRSSNSRPAARPRVPMLFPGPPTPAGGATAGPRASRSGAWPRRAHGCWTNGPSRRCPRAHRRLSLVATRRGARSTAPLGEAALPSPRLGQRRVLVQDRELVGRAEVPPRRSRSLVLFGHALILDVLGQWCSCQGGHGLRCPVSPRWVAGTAGVSPQPDRGGVNARGAFLRKGIPFGDPQVPGGQDRARQVGGAGRPDNVQHPGL